jgi:cysteine desulfurase/selenocysteine lyase
MRSDILGLRSPNHDERESESESESESEGEGLPALHYLDTAATALKPKAVVERMSYYLHYENGSPHRGAHRLSVKSTQLYQTSKERVRSFLGAGENWHVVYTKNATESLNLIASSLPNDALMEGEEIAITITAHHSNILPWQRLCKERGATLVYLYVDEAGQLLPKELDKIHAKTRLVSFPYIVNATGVVHPVKAIIQKAHQVGALAVVDAAQAVGHVPINLQVLDADLFVFSAHKVYGPTGIGVLVGKAEVLETFEPYMLGGDMIDSVTEQSATYAPLPQRLEAGTQHVVGAVGLMAAIDWLDAQGVEVIEQKERGLSELLYSHLKARGDIELYGPTDFSERGAIVSFNVKGVHSHDVASILDAHGVAIRAGHHCCQPLMHYLKIPSSCRASFGAYSHEEDVYALLRALDAVKEVFSSYVD